MDGTVYKVNVSCYVYDYNFFVMQQSPLQWDLLSSDLNAPV
jgi:hypothetical protein